MKTLPAVFVAVALAAPASAQDHRFGFANLSTGIRMHYAVQGDSAGEPVIMLHGTGDSWFSFSRIMPLLSPRFRVYALDQRGQGRSSRAATGYSMDDLAADVIAFMDAKGMARATVLGHSMGSLIARRVVHAAPDRVSRLVLVGSGTGWAHLAAARELGAAVRELTDPVSVQFIREFQYSTVYAPMPAEFMEQAISESRRLAAGTWRALLDGMNAVPSGPAMGMTSAPVLLISGDHDAVFPPEELRGLAAQIPHAVVRVYPETGHAPHWERPAQFAADLTAFLAGAGRATNLGKAGL